MVGLDPSIEADGATGYVLSAAVAVTSERASRIMGVALAAAADNAMCQIGWYGIFQVKVNGGNKGEFITGTNAQVYATPLTLTELQALTTAVGNVLGIALEDTSGVALAKCIFNGEAYRGFFGGDT